MRTLLLIIATGTVLLATLGCRDDTDSPTGPDAFATSPDAVAAGTPTALSQLRTGWYHTCAIATAQRAWCWGNNGAGALGTGSTSFLESATPLAVAGGHTFVQVSAGGYHNCAVTPQDKVYCWG